MTNNEFIFERFSEQLNLANTVDIEELNISGNETTFERKFDILNELSVPQFFKLRFKRNPTEKELIKLNSIVNSNH
jgi:hypothetical protein